MLLHLAIFTAALAEDLQVSSNVSGLSIVVNGEDTGLRTPATVRNVGAGSTVVQVGDSCRSGTAMTEVRAGARNEVTVRAEEQLATLTVAVKPAQAVVDVNGGKVTLSPNVPVGLPCGTYEITAVLKGYGPVSYSLELIGGQQLELPIELERLGVSTVEMSVSPRSATLLFDGIEVGQDAAALPTVYEGQHTLGATAKGYNDLTAPVWVSGGNNLVFRLELGRGGSTGSVAAVGGAGSTALKEGSRRAAAEAMPESEDTEESEPVLAVLPREAEVLDDEVEEEPDAELAPVKSWSERAAESAAKDKEREGAGDNLDEPVRTTNPKTGLRVGGGVLLGVGALVAGGGGYYTYSLAAESFSVWDGKDKAADAATGDQQAKLRAAEQDFYYNDFGPKNNLMIGVFGAGGALAATGLLLLVIEGDATPFVAPAPGGGVVGWAGAF
jgi:hypothetical protein